VSPEVVQERLGHHSHSFTADTYQHVMPGMDEAAICFLPAADEQPHFLQGMHQEVTVS